MRDRKKQPKNDRDKWLPLRSTTAPSAMFLVETRAQGLNKLEQTEANLGWLGISQTSSLPK